MGVASGASEKRLHKNSEMSWETRGNYRYYYRRRKINGRVEAEYIGSGPVADALARLDGFERQQRQHEVAKWRAFIAADRHTVAGLADVDELVRSAVTAVLIVNGYHTHKREWRRMSTKRRRTHDERT